MQLPVYLDHAATTPVLPAVLEAMMPYFTDFYGNPSALHQVGMAARDGVDDGPRNSGRTAERLAGRDRVHVGRNRVGQRGDFRRGAGERGAGTASADREDRTSRRFGTF